MSTIDVPTHLLGTKIEVEGTFVRSGKYRKRRGEWELVTWETALPSQLEVKLPSDLQQQLEMARTCAPQKPLQLANCMKAGANSESFCQFAKKICSDTRLCAKLVSHVAVSSRLEA
jgi:hypothetical protein